MHCSEYDYYNTGNGSEWHSSTNAKGGAGGVIVHTVLCITPQTCIGKLNKELGHIC